MEAQLLKALAKMSVSKVVTEAKKKAKSSVKEEAKYIGAKYIDDGLKHLTDKVKKDINSEVIDIMTMPQQMALEFKKQSSHQNGQPFQKSFNDGFYYNQYDYFNDYYNNQRNRYTATPQPNLAEVLWVQENSMRNRRNPDMYINPKR